MNRTGVDHGHSLDPRRDGWTAERQRIFIRALAECGCATHAAAAAGLSASSAYRLTAKHEALGIERVVDGVVETFRKDGVCIGERRRPSERLHIFLLKHLDPGRAVPPRTDVAFEGEPLDLPAGELSLLMHAFEDEEAVPDEGAALPRPAVDGDSSAAVPPARTCVGGMNFVNLSACRDAFGSEGKPDSRRDPVAYRSRPPGQAVAPLPLPRGQPATRSRRRRACPASVMAASSPPAVADVAAFGGLPGELDHLLEHAQVHVGQLVDVEAGLALLVLAEPRQ